MPALSLPRNAPLTPLAAALALLLGAGPALPARAADPAPVAAPSANQPAPAPAELPPIYVTARKRLENLINVPVSVSVFDGADLQDLRTQNVESVLRMTPNVGYSALGDGRSAHLSIRGVGTLAQPLGSDDTSVVVYIDGVPQPLFAADQQLLDVERVEVLRGPQGTLFGRNAQAGAIDIITRKPADTPELEGGMEAGSRQYRRGWASISGPIVADKLSGRLAVGYTGQDGAVRNLAGREVGDVSTPSLRGTLIARPDADTTLTLATYAQRDRNTPSNFVLRHTDDYPVVALDPEGHTERKTAGIALTAERRHDQVVATSVTALNHYGYDSLSNNSEALTFSKVFGLPASAFVPATDFSTYDENQNTFHQELRLNSQPQSPVAWVAGVNYYQDNYRLRSYYQSPFFPATNGWRDTRQRTRSYALFGEATTPLFGDPRLKLTGGLRYTRENKHYDAQYRNNGFTGNVAAFGQSGDLDYNLVTGRLSLGYDLTPTNVVYASAARGAKSGGFPNFTNNAVSGKPDQPYADANSWTFELGSKNQWLDNRLGLNAALFYNTVKNENLMAMDSGSFTFVPKSIDTRSYGAELETRYAVGGGFELAGSLGYTQAVVRNVSADVAASSGARNGNAVPSVPRWNAAVTLQYRGRVPGLESADAPSLFAAAQYQFVGARKADVGAHFDLDRYAIVNAKLGLEFARYDLYLFGQNLSNERPQYIGLYYGPGAEATTIGQGRVIGAGITMRY
ncbi:TonB-dependent receptor [Achromobacter xylosoxidans]|uniref:TonB-dependent receptor n=1 Tax=Alcaligenes xylosoxydans xylosoxydans TaxID=85698 RepID=UPI0006ABFE95|nr:TonB-dependent receptor [Achromobacter xylosoxidans]KOQ25284.1 TonB-dependent receptor [Achromobacter xylosoxidans]KOQ28382.1 TonB-dependent receptor [Achromobacter xylosoxidans]KOQ33364.1 TonB-dependent receptor [Achromobacter xylosoxidans]KOQ40730.1 TonB-dependent receptor [Achromobacter xylosoxidans]KOQ48031.1 TonB-dependent receptor [Achromobacter xylosoxidans]